MPAKSERQRRAAGAELGRRRSGVRGGKGRAFSTASTESLRHFARKPVQRKKRGRR